MLETLYTACNINHNAERTTRFISTTSQLLKMRFKAYSRKAEKNIRDDQKEKIILVLVAENNGSFLFIAN